MPASNPSVENSCSIERIEDAVQDDDLWRARHSPSKTSRELTVDLNIVPEPRE